MLRYELIDPTEQLISPNFKFIESFLKQTRRSQIGWHYITDIIWIYSHVQNWAQNFKVLDLGGGGGPLQFLLSELGFEVTNIDLCITEPKIAYKKRYNALFQKLDSWQKTSYKDHYESGRSNLKTLKNRLKKSIKRNAVYKIWAAKSYSLRHDRWRKMNKLGNITIGRLQWIRGNICHMPEIENDSFDAVVSLSSIEHIPINFLRGAINEINRVLKPNAQWAVTTSATENNETWFHEPSQGYCFSIQDLVRFFGLASDDSTDTANILEKYQKCEYLKRNLAKFYFKSEKNGMPLGNWNPKYIPVGIYR